MLSQIVYSIGTPSPLAAAPSCTSILKLAPAILQVVRLLVILTKSCCGLVRLVYGLTKAFSPLSASCCVS